MPCARPPLFILMAKSEALPFARATGWGGPTPIVVLA